MDSMFSLLLASSAPLKLSLSNSKAPSKPKLRPTTYGHYPQNWVVTCSISSCSTSYTAANTLRYCSSCSSCSLDPVFIFVCNNIAFSACRNSILKSSATTPNCTLDNAAFNAPGGIARSIGSSILTKSNPIFCNEPYAIVGSVGLATTRRFILFWSRITGVVRGNICDRQAPILAKTRECTSERSVDIFHNKLTILMHD